MENNFDVVVVGGGMVGATAAACLVQANMRVAIIEVAEPAPASPRDFPALRVSALSVASERILDSFGAWELLQDAGICPYRRMYVWEGEDDSGTMFDSADIAEPHLGHIVENDNIQRAAVERFKALGGEWLCPNQLHSFRHDSRGVELTLNGGETLRTTLLVGADGARSKVRELANIQSSTKRYDQHAMVATVRTERSQQDITWQRFVPTGPEALLPLKGSHASLVWYNTPEEVSRLKAVDDEQFLSELLDTFPVRLGKIEAILERGSFPLSMSHAESYIKPGVALIGDAAHSLHPLAGQGVNLGLMDAAALAEVVVMAAAQGRAFGSEAVLSKYQRWRRSENALMLRSMDTIQQLFSVDNTSLATVRRGMLGLADRVGPAKALVSRYAMGVQGDVPRLAKGLALR